MAARVFSKSMNDEARSEELTHSSPASMLHEALMLERAAIKLIWQARREVVCDERLLSAFQTSLSRLGESGRIVNDLENFLRNRFRNTFEPFYSKFFEDLGDISPLREGLQSGE